MSSLPSSGARGADNFIAGGPGVPGQNGVAGPGESTDKT